MDILGELHLRGSTLILITHDREVAESAERVIHVRDGQIHDGVA
jgi:putative ABC transport system ATP-binding protein